MRVEANALSLWQGLLLKTVACIASIFLLLSLFASRAAAQDDGGGALESVRLQLKWTHQFQFAGYYAAIKRGFYKAEGLDVVLKEGGPGINPVTAVVAGEAEYGITTSEIILDYAEGASVVLLAAIQQHSPFIFLARSDSGIYRPRDLVGRRIMYLKLLNTGLTMMLMNDGVRLGQVDLVEGYDGVEALAMGRVDAIPAYVTDAPYLLHRRGIPTTAIHPNHYGIDFYGDCLFMARKEAEEHPERAERFRRATLRGWAYAMANVGEMVEYIRAEYSPDAPAALLRYEAEALRGLILSDLVELGSISVERLRHIEQAYRQAGFISKPVDVVSMVWRPERTAMERLCGILLVALAVAVVGGIAAITLWVFNKGLRKGIRERTRELEDANEALLGEIGERAGTEEALRRSEAKFRALFDQTYQLCALLTSEGKVQMVNRSALDFAGVEMEDVIGTNFWDSPWWSHSPMDRERVQEGLLHARRGLTIRDEAEHIDIHGDQRAIDFTLKPVHDSSGEVVYILAEGRDVTDRKRAWEESRRLREVLQNVVDSLDAILVAVDVDLNLTLWNRKAAEAWGLAAEHPEERSLRECLQFESVSMERVRQTARGGKPYVEVGVAAEDGTVFYDVAVYPLAAGKGAVVRVDDVTQRMRMQQMMIQTEKMMSVGGLAAGMAHEINNPLGIILQSGQNLRRRFSPELAANQRMAEKHGIDLEKLAAYMDERGIIRYLEGIAEAGQRAAHIVSSMLKFSRRSEEHLESCELHPLLDAVIELAASDYDLKKKYDFRRIEIVRNYVDELPEVLCSRNQMEQVFLNLVKNAAEALADGTSDGKPPRIELRTERKGKKVCVLVADNGPGMAGEVKKRVFEPFFTTKPPGEGTGLGLSVAYFIVTNTHGGVFRVDSSPETGTVFTVELPLNGD